MAVEVGGLEAPRPRKVDLGLGLDVGLARSRVVVDAIGLRVVMEEALRVDEPRHEVAGGHRPPAIVLPLGRVGQVQADVEVGPLLPAMGHLDGPGAGHHQRRRREAPAVERVEDGLVGRVAHAEIIAVDDQNNILIGEPKPLRQGLLLGRGDAAEHDGCDGQAEREGCHRADLSPYRG